MRLLRIAKYDPYQYVGLYWTIRHDPMYRYQGNYTRDFIKKWLHSELKASGVVWEHTEKDPKTGNTLYIKNTDCTPKTNAVMYDENRITQFEQQAFQKLGYKLLSFQQAGFVANQAQSGQNQKTMAASDKRRRAVNEQEKQNLLDQLNQTQQNPMEGKKVSILTPRKQAANLDLSHVAKILGAKSVILNDRDAQVFIGDYSAYQALERSLTEDQKAHFFAIEDYEGKIFG